MDVPEAERILKNLITSRALKEARLIDPFSVFSFFIFIFGLMRYLYSWCNSSYYRKIGNLGKVDNEIEGLTSMEEEGAEEYGDKEFDILNDDDLI